MTQEELLNKLEEIRLKKDIPIDEFYPAIGISKSTFHLWKRGAVHSLHFLSFIVKVLKFLSI